MLEMLVHLYFEPSLFELLNVLLNLNKELVSCIDIMSVVMFNALISEFDDFFENFLRSSFSNNGLNWG